MARAAREELVSLIRGKKRRRGGIIDSFKFVCVCVLVCLFVLI